MPLNRRTFTASVSALSMATALRPIELVARAESAPAGKPLFVATWNFGLPACQKSWQTLAQGQSILDAVEQGIRVAEADPKVDSVGLGGAPNAAGVVQLDACFMDGATQKAGSVAALENYPHPISVARRVMEKTRHVMLVGPGAMEFAKAQGFETAELLTPEQKDKWLKWKETQAGKAVKGQSPNHDTIALLGIDSDGHIVGGCSTSGLAYKLPGRVGDSPILGSGLYVDGEVGAAGATGVGENVMRYCGSFMIVEFMRNGMEPAQACRAAIERITRLEKRPAKELHINFLAIDKLGRFGAAGTDAEFEVAAVNSQGSSLARYGIEI